MSGKKTLFAICYAALSVLAVFAAFTAPTGDRVVVFAPAFVQPGNVGAVIAGANGSIIGGTGLSWALVAQSDQEDFVAELYRHGAFYVADASWVLSCFGIDLAVGQPPLATKAAASAVFGAKTL